MDPFETGLVLAALIDGAALYGLLLARRRHSRRVEARLHESARLYGLVRITLADRRAA
jgi:hypothetical protein